MAKNKARERVTAFVADWHSGYIGQTASHLRLYADDIRQVLAERNDARDELERTLKHARHVERDLRANKRVPRAIVERAAALAIDIEELADLYT